MTWQVVILYYCDDPRWHAAHRCFCVSWQWSSAVILFIMLSGFLPFQHAKPGDWWFDRVRANQMHLFWQAHGRSCAFPEGAVGTTALSCQWPCVGPPHAPLPPTHFALPWTVLTADLMNRMLKDRPADRISVADVLAHPWLAGELGPADAVLVADLQRRKAEVKRQKQEEKEKALRARDAERRCVHAVWRSFFVCASLVDWHCFPSVVQTRSGVRRCRGPVPTPRCAVRVIGLGAAQGARGVGGG